MQIGPYQLVAPIGQGAFGSVFKARAQDGRTVALKLIRRTTDEARARFARERRLHERLGAEEGFVPVLDAGESREGPWLVMPFLSGGTLRERLGRRLEIEEALSLVSPVAAALARAHALGIVHRDVKPENVLFDEAGRPLVADLGLAKHFDRSGVDGERSKSLSQAGALRGTVGYLAPEQARDAARVGPPADVFALGAILYECLAGRAAFEGGGALEVLTAIEEARFSRLEEVRRDVPRWLASVVSASLAQDPARRPPDASAFLRAIAGPARGAWPRRAAVTLLVLAAGAATAAALATRERPAPPATPRWRSGPATPEDPPARAATAQARAHAAFLARRASEVADVVSCQPALADATLAVWFDPGCAAGWGARALARSYADREGADRDAAVALAIDPRTPDAIAARALLRGLGGDAVGAVADLDRVVAMGARKPSYRALRGMWRGTSGDVKGALEDFDAALLLDPRHAVALSVRAQLLLGLGDHAGAQRDARAALASAPSLARTWEVLARSLLREDRAKEAEEAYSHAIALSPGDPRLREARAATRMKLGDRRGVEEDSAALVRLDPKVPKHWHGLAELYSIDGRWKEAIVAMTKAIDLEKTWQRLQRRADFHARLAAQGGKLDPGEVKLALDDLDAAIRLAPREGSLYTDRGAQRMALLNLDGAGADLDEAIRLGERSRALLFRAFVRSGQGDVAGARADLEAGLADRKLEPELRRQAEGLRAQLEKR